MANEISKASDREDPEVRIEKLKAQVNELVGGKMVSGSSSELPPEIEERFWEHVLAYEKAEQVKLFDLLVKGGMVLPPPAELDDSRLHAVLWEVINGMALLGTYLENTDHLSDRELYGTLWNDLLREDYVLLPDESSYACHIDVIGSGSEEDVQLYLKYYADKEYRSRWADEWPKDPIPDHADLPYHRDQDLPKPAY